MEYRTARKTGHLDVSLMGGEDVLCDCQAQAGAVGFGREKGLENSFLLIFWDARAIIRNVHLYIISFSTAFNRANLDRERVTSLIHRLDGVGDQVIEDLFQGARITLYQGRAGVDLDVHLDLLRG